MKRRIILHGKLKKLCPDGLEFDTDTIAETIQALNVHTKAFRPVPGQPRIAIRVVGCDTEESFYEPNTDMTEVHIVPGMVGGKNGGFFQMIAGAVLIVVGVVVGVLTGWTGIGAVFASSLIGVGIGMVAGGILQLMSPSPRIDTPDAGENDPDVSKYLGSPHNTVKIGTRIPIIYGRRMHGGHILSANVDAVDVAA